MSQFKMAGCCSKCDEPCFDVKQIWTEGERYPGEPKRLGKPLPGATRISFVLLDGTHCDLTFCGDCTNSVGPDDYTELWRKVIRSWQRELNKDHPGEERPDWYPRQFANGLLSEMARVSWEKISG